MIEINKSYNKADQILKEIELDNQSLRKECLYDYDEIG